MSYEVLARKWRPQQFPDVVGQGHVTETLQNAITSKRVAHAYIFVGPRGVGKTSIARIFAKALNCRKGATSNPCDECESCVEIVKGSNLDVLEIDGASNNGVEQVRELRDNVRYAPARGPYKVYIIDEVHMLSIGAFNALLKTLEEPPSHVKFIFATTEVQKVPATILSRCQRFDLRRISTRDIVSHLGKISKAEKIKIDDDALLAIARGAEGGLRDAESALDQLIAFRGKTITEPDVLSVFGLVARKELEGLAEAILKGDVGSVLRSVSELDASGKDLQRLTIELLEHFRNLLVASHAEEMLKDQDLPEQQIATLRNQAKIVDGSRLAEMVDVLIDVQSQLRYALSRRTTLEISLVKAARIVTTVSIDEVLQRLQQARQDVDASVPAAAQPTMTQERPTVPYAAPSVKVSAPVHAPGEDLKRIVEHWREIVSRVGGVDLVAKSNLVDARPVDVSGDRVTFAFDPEFAGNAEKLQNSRGIRVLQKVLEDFLGRAVIAQFKIASGEGPAPSAPPATSKPADAARTTGSKSRQQWVGEPAVKRALETFNGDIVDIHE